MHTANRHASVAILLCLAASVNLSSCARVEPECEGRESVAGVDLIRGLWTNPVDLNAPEGSLAVADNLELNEGKGEPFPGFELLSLTSIGGTINRIIEYRGSLIAHYSTASIARWTGSAWSAYSGTFTPPTGTKVRLWEASGSLFVTTTLGVYELDSPTGTWRLTGSPGALQGVATLRRTTSEAGNFTSANGQWAYRYVWLYRNANNRYQRGPPSGRFMLIAPANIVATAANISKAGSAVVTVINTTHGFATGEYVDVTLGGAEANFAAGRFQVTVVSSTSFTYNDGGAAFTGNPGNNITYGFSSRNASLTAPIPSGITTDYVLEVYRSAKSADANTEPSDALSKVAERAPTNLEITAGSMTVLDITPDGSRQDVLYTSSGTLLDAKERPPQAKECVEFRGSVFYADVTAVETLFLAFLAVGTPLAIQVGDQLTFQDRPDAPNLNTWVVVVTIGATEDLPNGQCQLFTTGSVAQNIADTAKSFIRAINGNTTNTKLYAEYMSTDTEPPGRVIIRGRDPTIERFCVRVFHSITSTATAPGRTIVPTVPTSSTIQDMARAGSTVTVNLNMAHGYAVGQQVELIHSTNTTLWPNGIKTVASTPSGTQFTYTEAGTASSAVANGGEFVDQALTLTASKDEAITNAYMWTPEDEPWSVPKINYDELGPSGSTIMKWLVLTDRLIALTDKGAFQIQGGPPWTVTEYDVSFNLSGRNLACVGDNKGVALSPGGVGELLESVRHVSTPVEDVFRGFHISTVLTALATYGFAVPYESKRQIWFFLPDDASSTAARQVYIYHQDSRDWTRRVLDADSLSSPGTPMGPTAQDALVTPSDGKMTIATGGYVVKERKTGTVADQRDPVIPGTLTVAVSSVVDGTTLALTPAAGMTLSDFFPANSTIRNATGAFNDTVLTVDDTTNQITVASTASYSAGHSLYPTVQPITSTIEPVAIDEEEPGRQKVFIEGSLNFRDTRFTAASLQFATDLNPTLSDAMTLAPPGGSTSEARNIDFWVPLYHRRGTRLRMRFEHSNADERYALQSWRLRSRICSPRTQR